jgi:gamma-aminobutyric acid type B receptor
MPPHVQVCSLGYATTCSGLFAKQYRVQTIVNSKKLSAKPLVTEAHVLLPFILLLTADVVVLTAWTIPDLLTYVRVDHKGTDGWNRIVSTYGTCLSENVVPCIVPLAEMNIGVLLVGKLALLQEDEDDQD